MRIVRAYPPNFPTILAHFPDARKPGVMFTYGDVIYAPGKTIVTPALKAHEAVHGERQAVIGIEPWWDRYIADVKFRFAEELLAHQAEYRWFRQYRPGKCRQALHEITSRLSSGLYGGLVAYADAKRFIEQQIALRPYAEPANLPTARRTLEADNA